MITLHDAAAAPVASAQVDLLAPCSTPRAFHPSLGVPEDRLIYRPCPLFHRSGRGDAIVDIGRKVADTKTTFQVAIPPASIPLIFAHRQWRAGLLLGDLLAAAADVNCCCCSSSSPWRVNGLTVLELGCGTGIPGMISSRLGGASSVLITDYDAPPLVQTLRRNLASNFEEGSLRTSIRSMGYTWGTNVEDLQDTLDMMIREKKRAGLSIPTSTTGSGSDSDSDHFHRILLADCIWDSLSHDVLLRSLTQLLARPSPDSRSRRQRKPHRLDHTRPLILFVSGFHTGRETLLSFIRRAHRLGLVLQEGVDSSSLLPTLPSSEEAVIQTERVRLGEEAAAHPLWLAPRLICEVELAAEADTSSEGLPPDSPSDAASATAIVDAGFTPRLTGRRRAFVLEEREEEKKENGGVLIRNRWMTIFALGWAEQSA